MGIYVGAGVGTGEGVLNVEEDNDEIHIPQTLVCCAHLPLFTPIHRMDRVAVQLLWHCSPGGRR